MMRVRIDEYAERTREELRTALTESHSPREIAGSFSLGAFITMLPTLGVGLLAFVVIAYVFDRVSKIALFASVLVFNPLVKWGVYAASFTLGVLLLGPVDGVSTADVSMSAGPDIVIRLLVGNLIFAAIATVPSYVIVHRFAVRYHGTEVGQTIEGTIDELVEEVFED